MTPTISSAPDESKLRLLPTAELTIPRRAARPALWMVGVQLLELGSQTLAGILIARCLGSAALGDFTYGFSLAAILSVLLLFGSGDVAISLYADGRTNPNAVLSSSLRIWARGSLLCATLAFGWILVQSLSERTAWAVLAAVATLLINGLGSVLNQAIVAHRASHLDLGGVLLSRVALLAMVSSAALEGSLTEAFMGYLVAGILLCTFRAMLVHRVLFPIRLVRDTAVDDVVWSRGRFVGVGSIFGSISARADTLMLHAFAGADQTGLYGASYRIINGIDAASGAIASARYPDITRQIAAGDHAGAQRTTARIALLLSAGIAVTIPFASMIMGLVYGESFRTAGPLLAVLLSAAALQVVLIFFHKWCIATAREALLPRGQFCAAFVNLTANALLIPRLGAMGAALSTLIAEACLAGFYLLILLKPALTQRSSAHEA